MVHHFRFSTTEYELKLKCDAGQEYATASETMTDVTAEGGHLYLIPQNITYNARIVVTVDGTKLGFPFEDLFQLLPGQEYTIDLVIPGSKPLDYTDNAMPAFLLAPVDAAEAANVSWADAKSACEASGYRLPTYNEGLMILFYMNGMEKTTCASPPTGLRRPRWKIRRARAQWVTTSCRGWDSTCRRSALRPRGA